MSATCTGTTCPLISNEGAHGITALVSNAVIIASIGPSTKRNLEEASGMISL